MVLIPFGDGRYSCISGDVKPTAGITSGSKLTEYGLTTIDYYFNGAAWEPQPEAIAGPLTWGGAASGIRFSGLQRLPLEGFGRYEVWASGNLYQAMDTNGIITYSGASAYIAIQTAISGTIQGNYLNRISREMNIRGGAYIMDSTFSGFSLADPITINMAHGAMLLVPVAYSGDVFRIENKGDESTTLQVNIRGGTIHESGVATGEPRSNWTAFHLYCSGSLVGAAHKGVVSNRIQDTVVHNAGKCVWIECGTNGWINANSFERLMLFHPHTFFKFNTNSGDGSYRNEFMHFFGEAMSGVTRALVDGDNLYGSQNEFICNDVSDLAGSGSYSMHIGVSGTNTVVVGGTMGYTDFYHSGVGLKLFDEFHGVILDDSVHISGVVYTQRIDTSGSAAILVLANGASGQAGAIRVLGGVGGSTNNAHISLYDSAISERLLMQHTATASDLVSQRVAAGGGLRILRFQMIDSPAGTTIEPMRMDLSGNVIFNISGGVPRFMQTSTTKTDTAANSGTFAPAGYLTAQRSGGTQVKIPYFAD